MFPQEWVEIEVFTVSSTQAVARKSLIERDFYRSPGRHLENRTDGMYPIYVHFVFRLETYRLLN